MFGFVLRGACDITGRIHGRPQDASHLSPRYNHRPRLNAVSRGTCVSKCRSRPSASGTSSPARLIMRAPMRHPLTATAKWYLLTLPSAFSLQASARDQSSLLGGPQCLAEIRDPSFELEFVVPLPQTLRGTQQEISRVSERWVTHGTITSMKRHAGELGFEETIPWAEC